MAKLNFCANWMLQREELNPGCADFTENIAPRLTRAGVALETRKGLVKRLLFGWSWRTTGQQVGFVKFSETGENLRTVTDRKPGQFFKDLSFAHDTNLARPGFSRKRDVTSQPFNMVMPDHLTPPLRFSTLRPCRRWDAKHRKGSWHAKRGNLGSLSVRPTHLSYDPIPILS